MGLIDMRRLDKAGQFNFVWLFAILAGGSILALAIWGALQTGDTLRYSSDTQAAASISILTDPLQSGFAEGSYGVISFRSETKINNICSSGDFGKNDISIATRSGVGDEWNDAGGASSVHNKYIFSKEQVDGEDFYVFSKGFEFPYKTGDLIFLFSDRYCFLNAPEFVENDVGGLGIDNVVLENCSVEDVRVCFGGGSDCDIIVYGACSSGCESAYDYGRVVKASEDMMYVGNLMYGAIFSDRGIYDCNIERLMYRTSNIAKIFGEKASLMNSRGCDTNLRGKLFAWRGVLENASSDDLISLSGYANSLGKDNDGEVCGMW
jgi:hypothetical protein